ncbi:MAG: trimeric intracellular cation channel family protein [Flavobacterium sp.]|nr:trimeric intracellular cation channel family protein [Candidatus Neoflavobacterium equi]
MPISLFELLDAIGTVAFAVSGALTAMNKRLDAFGVFIISFVTAVGGGTLRDMLIGRTPVVWMRDINYVYLILISFLLAILFRRFFDKLRNSLLFFDTVGLGVFTLIGLEKGIDIHLNPIICIALGTMTASFGGVIRDILCNEIPVIFREEIYATVCIAGGVFYFILAYFDLPTNQLYLGTSSFIILFRFLAIRNRWSLPKFKAMS